MPDEPDDTDDREWEIISGLGWPGAFVLAVFCICVAAVFIAMLLTSPAR